MRQLARLLLSCCLLLTLTGAACATSGQAGSKGAKPETATDTADKYEYMKRFSKAFELVRTSYVRDVSNDEIISGAIKGMLQHLDPHSSFLDKDEYKKILETTSGEFFGIGIEMASDNNQLMVITPIEDTPAYKAGLKAGDVILAIDGDLTQEMSAQEAASRIRGPKGTEVTLLILHKNSSKPENITMKRDTIPLISVKSRFLDEDGFAWVRITRFSEKTTAELLENIAKLEKIAPIQGIVLDLRNNPGGLLNESVSVANAFIKTGDIVSIRGRGDKTIQAFAAKSRDHRITCPMVALVNSGTASAAEIVAGALQDHNRALLVGEGSFGKGSVQKIIPLDDGDTAIKMTIALYYTPNGRSIQAEGIKPDIEMPFEATAESNNKFNINLPREKDLSGHLEQNGAKATAKDKGKGIVLDDDTKEILESDNQIRLGLQLVKGLPRIAEIHN